MIINLFFTIEVLMITAATQDFFVKKKRNFEHVEVT